MKAVILAGGRGSRLLPLTKSTPKPLVPIIDKPIMEHLISRLVASGITEIGVTTGYLAEQIIARFGTGKSLGASLTYFVETSPLGTAGSVKGAQTYLSDDFLVLSGDIYTTLNFRSFINFYKRQNSVFSLVATPRRHTKGLGVLDVAEDCTITAFREKPATSFPGIINCGIYCINKQVLYGIPENTPFDFGKDLIPRLVGKAHAYVTKSYWSDVGTLPAYYHTNYLLSKKYQAQSP